MKKKINSLSLRSGDAGMEQNKPALRCDRMMNQIKHWSLRGCAFTAAVALSVLGLCACRNTEQEPGQTNEPGTTMEDPSTTTTPPDDKDPFGVRKDEVSLPLNKRTEGIQVFGGDVQNSESQLNCQWSGSGFGFSIESTGDNVQVRMSTSKRCYFRVYVDGAAWAAPDGSPYYMINGARDLVLEGISEGKHQIRIVRVSNYSAATACFYSVTFYGKQIMEPAAAEPEFSLEVIGEGIAAGIGLGGTHEDGELAYPALLAELFHAPVYNRSFTDNSLVSGSNPISKWYPASEKRSTKADIVIVDVGAADFAREGDEAVSEQDFAIAYQDLLRAIRQRHGASCKILCLYGAVNDGYGSVIQSVCAEVGGESAGFFTYEMQRCEEANPGASVHEAYANALKPILEQIRAAEISGSLNVEESGIGSRVDYNDLNWR